MTIGTALWANRPTLVQGFHIAIVNALNASWAACAAHRRGPHEPDLVASLVLDATPTIYGLLSTSLRPYGIVGSVSAVFCHQSPKVKHVGPHAGTCELGDILFVYSHRPLHGPSTRIALLLQAKTAARNPYTVPSSERVQLDLYVAWPPFTYSTPASLRGQARDIRPKGPHVGAQYLLLDSGHPANPVTGLLGKPGTFPAGCCMPGPQLHIHTDLASALFELLLLKTGRPFEPRGGTTDDWSNMVWDLIQTGLAKAFNSRRSGRMNAPRHSGGPVLFEDGSAMVFGAKGAPSSLAEEALGPGRASALYGSDGAAGVPAELSESVEDDGDGVSLVLIETQQLEG